MTADQKVAVIYDGECSFCIEQIERIRSMDKFSQFEYMPRQSPEADERFPVLKSIDFDKGMRLITPEGRTYSGMDAVYEIGRRLPSTRKIAWVYNVPGLKQIFRLAYAFIAANRKRLGKTCQGGVCDVSGGADDRGT